MILTRMFTTLDTTIGHLPTLLANAVSGFVVAGFSFAYAYLATGQWWTRHYHPRQHPAERTSP